MELMQASRQWAMRPDEERFMDLPSMASHLGMLRAQSSGRVVASRALTAEPVGDFELVVTGPNGHPYAPSHHAFGQLATLAMAPAGYLRTLPAALAADNINYGLKFKRDIEDTGVLLQRNGHDTLRAVTGPNYGRIWNVDVVNALIDRFGDGVTGAFRVPGEFGREVTVTKANTTLYAGDRDMFVFLADERNRIEIPDRRDGRSGSLARGFFVWNSEVGAAKIGVSTFLFDHVCCNRIVWGAQEVKQFSIRHNASAPERFVAEMIPAIQAYAESSASSVTQAIENARAKRFASSDKLTEFLQQKRFSFTAKMVTEIKQIHMDEEGRPIESLWDAATAITARARSIPYQNERVDMESKAGKILDLAA